jgi:ribosomal protein S18 acetylase RimI-like enzyme
MDLTFRDFEEKDFGDLREMMFCLYEEDPEGVPITEAKIKKTVAESEMHPDKLRIVMLSADGVNIGYCIIVFFWSNEYGGNAVVIDELYVKKEYRNKGIASKFILSRFDAYDDVVSLKIESTPSNEAGARLYERLGFVLSENHHLLLIAE